ncbi:unnamed protein product [Auanema sp. JU1783]|nr:unnamed protein product [Auanema sp. JU1783]
MVLRKGDINITERVLLHHIMLRLICLLLLVVSMYASPSWRSCTYCEKVVNDYYIQTDEVDDGLNSTSTIHIEMNSRSNVNDTVLQEYFSQTCPHYMIISVVLSEICLEMSQDKSQIVFPGLEHHRRANLICFYSDYCSN